MLLITDSLTGVPISKNNKDEGNTENFITFIIFKIDR